MADEKDVIKVAIEVCRKILVFADGHPAKIVAVGVAAGAASISAGIGYGIYKYGNKLLRGGK